MAGNGNGQAEVLADWEKVLFLESVRGYSSGKSCRTSPTLGSMMNPNDSLGLSKDARDSMPFIILLFIVFIFCDCVKETDACLDC